MCNLWHSSQNVSLCPLKYRQFFLSMASPYTLRKRGKVILFLPPSTILLPTPGFHLSQRNRGALKPVPMCLSVADYNAEHKEFLSPYLHISMTFLKLLPLRSGTFLHPLNLEWPWELCGQWDSSTLRIKIYLLTGTCSRYEIPVTSICTGLGCGP